MFIKFKKIIEGAANFFTFSKPEFVQLHYAHILIKDCSYLLITWTSSHASKLSIAALKYSSYRPAGSAYILFPENTTGLHLKLSNLWRSCRVVIRLNETSLDTQKDYYPVRSFKDLSMENAYRPEPKSILKAPYLLHEIKPSKTPVFRFIVKNLQN